MSFSLINEKTFFHSWIYKIIIIRLNIGARILVISMLRKLPAACTFKKIILAVKAGELWKLRLVNVFPSASWAAIYTSGNLSWERALKSTNVYVFCISSCVEAAKWWNAEVGGGWGGATNCNFALTTNAFTTELIISSSFYSYISFRFIEMKLHSDQSI